MESAEEAPQDQLGVQLSEYAGQWVAVADRAVVGSADTLDELLEWVEGQAQRVEVFRAPRHPDAPLLF